MLISLAGSGLVAGPSCWVLIQLSRRRWRVRVRSSSMQVWRAMASSQVRAGASAR